MRALKIEAEGIRLTATERRDAARVELLTVDIDVDELQHVRSLTSMADVGHRSGEMIHVDWAILADTFHGDRNDRRVSTVATGRRERDRVARDEKYRKN